jgi:Domain found in Dishevelled, Egl-10, and Pleckstrin (DEP)
MTMKAGSDHSILSCNTNSSSSSNKEGIRLEALADTLQAQLRVANLIQDRKKSVTKKIPNCFLGRDAVTVLMDILQVERREGTDESDDLEESLRRDCPVTREEALTVGREIAKRFRFFVHADDKIGKKKLMLEDTDEDRYIFHNNLPIEVYKMKKQHPSAWDRAAVLEKHVEVKVRQGLVRIYVSSFVASEAVDVLMELKLVRSRGEGVHAMQKMNEKVKFFKIVNPSNQFEFKDDKNMFLQFTAKESWVKDEPKHEGKRISHVGYPSRGSFVNSSSCSLASKNSGALSPNSNSPTKDEAYFKRRARAVRQGLGHFHEKRSSSSLSLLSEQPKA